MRIFSGSSSRELSRLVAECLDTRLSEIENFIFPDGERRVRIKDNVLDQDCVLIQSTNPPVDTHYIETFLLVDGLKRSGARSVVLIMPYMGYMRQDHIFRDGEAVSLELMIALLERSGVNRFYGFDFHTVKLPEMFRIPAVELSALELFAGKIKNISSRGKRVNKQLLVSPDMGGLRRIGKMQSMLDGMEWIAAVKDRDVNTGSIKINHFDRSDESRIISGADCYLVDDMISSGGTIVEAARLLKKSGAHGIYVFATHALFSEKASDLLQSSLIDRIFVSDTVSIADDKKIEKLEIISVASVIADAIGRDLIGI